MTETITTNRNQQISATIDAEKKPLLPFELEVAHASLEAHIIRQGELGNLLKEAMEQSSETWHDNAPADAITSEAHRLVNAAEGTIHTIDNGDVFSYADTSSNVITLGSIVEAEYLDTNRRIKVLLTGVTRKLPEGLANDLGDDISCVTLSSPLGQAIFNIKSGDEAQFSVNDRVKSLKIISVTQFHPL